MGMNKSDGLNFRSAVAAILLFGALTIILERIDARTLGKRTAEPTTVPRVEQGNKNIKVLNGMPESQLIPAMKFFTVSLGVACDYCHVSKNGQLEAPADDKKTKRIARAMIKMVMEVNATTFREDMQISCYTCHRGQPIPQSAPNIPVALKLMLPSGAAPASSPTATPPLPTADEILNKYTNAIGGSAAIEKIKSAVIQGTVANASGSTGTFEADQVAPDKGYEIVTTQRGTRVRVLNQRKGWEKTAYGVDELAGQQLQDIKLSLVLFGSLNLKDQFTEFEVAGVDKIDNHEVYAVKATRADQKAERLFFDSESGLLLRRVTEIKSLIGIIPEETDFDDYQEVEGVKLPGTIRLSAVDTQNPTSTRKIDKIQFNVPVDESRFGKPD
jgi:hypothetical protein